MPKLGSLSAEPAGHRGGSSRERGRERLIDRANERYRCGVRAPGCPLVRTT